MATGTIDQGTVKQGDEVEVLGYNRRSKRSVAISVETFKKSLDVGETGDNIGVLLRNLPQEAIRRGMLLSQPGQLSVFRNFQADIYVPREDEGGRKLPFKSGFKPQIYIQTADVACQIFLPEDRKMAMQGDHLSMRGHLDRPLPIGIGTRFALREGGKTVASGIMTKIHPDPPEDVKEDLARDASQLDKKKKADKDKSKDKKK